jgi:maltooligosyltrehalose synthase
VDDAQAIVVAPRLIQGLLIDNRPLPDWADTEVVVPGSLQRDRHRLVLEDRELAIPRVSSALALSRALTDLPFALLLSS